MLFDRFAAALLRQVLGVFSPKACRGWERYQAKARLTEPDQGMTRLMIVSSSRVRVAGVDRRLCLETASRDRPVALQDCFDLSRTPGAIRV